MCSFVCLTFTVYSSALFLCLAHHVLHLGYTSVLPLMSVDCFNVSFDNCRSLQSVVSTFTVYAVCVAYCCGERAVLYVYVLGMCGDCPMHLPLHMAPPGDSGSSLTTTLCRGVSSGKPWTTTTVGMTTTWRSGTAPMPTCLSTSGKPKQVCVCGVGVV